MNCATCFGPTSGPDLPARSSCTESWSMVSLSVTRSNTRTAVSAKVSHQVVHQFGLHVVGQAGHFFTHQLAGHVPAARDRPTTKHAFGLRLAGRLDGPRSIRSSRN